MGRCRRPRWPAALTRTRPLVLALALLWCGSAAADPVALQLDVSINGYRAGLIGAFSLDGEGRLMASRGELAALGIAVPGAGPEGDLVVLSEISGLRADYDAAAQAVALTAPPQLLVERHYDAAPRERVLAAPRAAGLVVNYAATAGSDAHRLGQSGAADGALSVEAHGSTKFGVVHQSAVAGTAVAAAPVLRLETSWSYSDDDKLRSYRAGDIMTGSLTWTRPVRMAGLQVQRNFALRPDIVTMPLPAARGSAAVPSTVDVYVDNVKTYSGAIGAGPFVIDNLPAGSGRTAATVVVTDVTGRRSEQRLEVVNVPELLRKGLIDYSLEAGLVRRSFGSRSFDYGHDPAASATLRAGLTDRLTVEGHGELTSRLINGGAGGYLPLGSGLGVVNGGLAVSAGPDGAGASVFAAWRGNMGPLALQVAASRSFGSFADLASVFSTSQTGSGAPLWSGGGIPRAQLRAALSYHWETVNADLRASLVRTTRQGGAHELTATAGLSKSFGKAATVFADGFAGNRHDYGASLGVSFPLGHHALGSSLVRVSRQGGVTGWAQAQKAAEERPGSYGWRVGRTAGEAADTLEASAVYRGSLARLEAGATQQAGAVRLRATADGSLVVADGGLFLAGTTGEAYAVVDAGAPNVPVLLENQVIGKTGKAGKLLVPGLSAYQKSRLSLDVRSLPVTAVIPSTEMVVVPRDHSGVTAEFGVRAQAPSAVVIVVDEAGHALPAGTPLALSGAPAAFFVGYEGRAFVTGLAAANRITAELAGGSCSGSFAFAPEGDTQQVLGPVTCRLAQ